MVTAAALGVTCELHNRPDGTGRSLRRRRPRWRRNDVSIGFVEFLELSDGSRYVVRSDRGLNTSLHNHTCKNFAHAVRECFRQYEQDRPTAPEWVSERLRRMHGIDVDEVSIGTALSNPYRVELGPRLEQALATGR